MAKYITALSFADESELGNKGLVVTVKQENGSSGQNPIIKGHLMIGKVHLVWFDAHKKKKGHKVSWEDFETWIMQKPEIKTTRP